MRTRVITDAGEFAALAGNWSKLLSASGFNIVFLTHQWLSAWWENYGAEHKLLIIAVERDGELIALAPFMVTVGRKLQFIGHDVSDYLDLIVAEQPEECFRMIFEEIKRQQEKWDFAEFIYIAEDSPNFSFWQKELRELKTFKKELKRDCAAVVLDLYKHGDGWPALERTLPPKRRNDLRRYPRQLAEKGELTFRRLSDLKEIEAAFGEFAESHRRRWRAVGRGSQFDSDRQVKRYLNIAKHLAPHGWAELSFLKLDDQCVAMAFGYTYSGRYYYYTPTFNPDYWKYSPSNLLIKRLIESFYAEGRIKVFDLLRGEEKYKYSWSKDERQLYRARIYPWHIRSAILFIKHSVIQAVLPRLQQYPLLRKIKHALLKLVPK